MVNRFFDVSFFSFFVSWSTRSTARNHCTWRHYRKSPRDLQMEALSHVPAPPNHPPTPAATQAHADELQQARTESAHEQMAANEAAASRRGTSAVIPNSGIVGIPMKRSGKTCSLPAPMKVWKQREDPQVLEKQRQTIRWLLQQLPTEESLEETVQAVALEMKTPAQRVRRIHSNLPKKSEENRGQDNCTTCGNSTINGYEECICCAECSDTFHKQCLPKGTLAKLRPAEGTKSAEWFCPSCTRKQHQQLRDPSVNTVTNNWRPKTNPSACQSCSQLSKEVLTCLNCAAVACFECACVSIQTVPCNWLCQECLGIGLYDEKRQQVIQIARTRVGGQGPAAATVKEKRCFAQLVFDLYCACNWDEWDRNIDTLVHLTNQQLENGKIPPLQPFHALHYAANMDKTLLLRISKAYAKQAEEEAYKAANIDARQNPNFNMWEPAMLEWAETDSKKRLRIGYLSSDFVDHPTADLIQSALFKHNRNKFEIFCYSISREDESDYRLNIASKIEHFEHFANTMSDEECAQRISKDGIHILIYLSGYTEGSRNGIAALRPAPRQVVYLAYPGTMGADYIDYNVTDEVVCPLQHREYYHERLIYMPHCYQVNSHKELYSDVTSEAESKVSGSPFVFCNFCRLGRITRVLFAVWMTILKQVPDSVIWLYRSPTSARCRLQDQAVKAGVDPKRLIFQMHVSPKLKHLQRVSQADLALDTLVYNGHTTASDMLWAGVPLITIRGDNWPSLVAASIACAAEMDEMVVENLDGYADLAVDLAKNRNRLQTLKTKLAQKRMTAPLFDTGKWILHFEISLDEVWRRYVQKEEEPRDLIVKDMVTKQDIQYLPEKNSTAESTPFFSDRTLDRPV